MSTLRKMVDYPDTEHTGLDSEMTEDNRNRKQVQISLSENQIAATDKAAADMGMKRSEFIRYALSQVVNSFPNDLPAQGENLKKRVS